MNKIIVFLSLLILPILQFCNPGNEDLKTIGKIQPRSSNEIASSMLWIGGEVLDRDLCDYDAYKGYLGELGAKKIRLQSGWAKTEKVRGVYDFAWLDHVVDDAIFRGVQPWIQISYGNPIYPGGGGASLGQGLVSSDEALEAFARYTEALVGHFKDRVNEWEIWNEADHRHNKEAGSDEQTYARLYLRVAETVKKVQPEARIVALSIAGVSRIDFVSGFFDFMVEHDALDLVDVVTFHGYPTNPDNGFKTLYTFMETIKAYKPSIEFWQGETGCPSTLGSTGALKNHAWTEHTQAKWDLRRALAHTGRDINFSLFLLSEFVYNDALRKGLNSKGILKINEDDFSVIYPKPAYFAYQNLCSVFGQEISTITDLNFTTASTDTLSVFAWKTGEGKPILAYWEKSGIPSDEDVFSELEISVEEAGFNNPVLVNPMNGAVQRIPGRNWNQQGAMINFSQLPLIDYPLIIAEESSLLIK